MTLPPNRVGDRGQRFEVRVDGDPKSGDNVIGWANDRDSAARMGIAALKAPSAAKAHVVDRETCSIVAQELKGKPWELL